MRNLNGRGKALCHAALCHTSLKDHDLSPNLEASKTSSADPGRKKKSAISSLSTRVNASRKPWSDSRTMQHKEYSGP